MDAISDCQAFFVFDLRCCFSEIVYTDGFDPYQRKQGPRRKKRWTIEGILNSAVMEYIFLVDIFSDCF